MSKLKLTIVIIGSFLLIVLGLAGISQFKTKNVVIAPTPMPTPTIVPTPTPLAILFRTIFGQSFINEATQSASLSAALAIFTGDNLKTSVNSLAEIDFGMDTKVWLGPLTEATLSGTNALFVKLGSIFGQFTKTPDRSSFVVENASGAAFIATDSAIWTGVSGSSPSSDLQTWMRQATTSATPTQKPKPTTPPLPVLQGPPGNGISTVMVKTEKGEFKATILSIDLTTAKMLVDTASDSDCSDNCPVLSLRDYVSKNGGFAGVNGTYFCPDTYPDCAGKKNSFDFPVYNSRLNKWMQGDKLGWTHRRAILYTDGSGAHYQNNSAGFSGGTNAAIINYPGLVDGGNTQIDENQSGLSNKQKLKGTKVGIGTRGTDNVMVVIAYNTTMYEFAYVFKALGAKGALNLDSGGSLALINNGSYVFGPGRNLPNAIIFARK